jgi:bifunctional UDP-N-acetylglucosamine pyrophosphorylase/glucosamine-1-phosphate N-acetyltransferase
VVVGYQAEEVRAAFAAYRPAPQWVVQPEQRGTADAVRCAVPFLKGVAGTLVVLYGDVPLLRRSVLQALLERHRQRQAPLTVLTALLPDPSGYGRIVRDGTGRFLRIVEHADASSAETEIREINTGIYCFEVSFLLEALDRVTTANAQREYYLTDLAAYAVSSGRAVEWVQTDEPMRALGINTRRDLAEAERILREEICCKWMLEGVTIVDPGTTCIDASVVLGRDTRIEPGCHLRGVTRVGPNSLLGVGSILIDAKIGRGVQVLPYSVLEGSQVKDGGRVGPLAHIQGGTVFTADTSAPGPARRRKPEGANLRRRRESSASGPARARKPRSKETPRPASKRRTRKHP